MEKILKSKLGMIIVAIFVTFLWGSAFPFIKLSYALLDIQANEIGEQLLFAGYRFFLASILISFVLLIRYKKIVLQKNSIRPIMKIGLFQTALQYFFFYIGLSYSTGIQGSIIAGGTGTFFAVILAHLFYRQSDAMSTRKIIGVFIGFIGVILANIPQGQIELQFGFGELFLLISALMGSLGNIYAKQYSHQFNPVYLTAFQMMLGSFFLLIVGIFKAGAFPFDFNFVSFGMLLYLSFLSAAGFTLWNSLLKYHKISLVSMFMFLIPVFGVSLSSMMLREALTGLIFLALMFVITGIIIVNKSSKAQKEVKIPAPK